MEQAIENTVRNFRIYGNYLNQRGLASQRHLHHCNQKPAPALPGYLPSVVEFVLNDGTTGSIEISDSDVAVLCNRSSEDAKTYLALILEARKGDVEAANRLASWVGQEYLSDQIEFVSPVESRYIVPCTSHEPHSELDISEKGFTLLKLSRGGYPVPDFVVLTIDAYAEREKHLEEHIADAFQQLQVLTGQNIGDAEKPLVVALRSATSSNIPGLLDTYLNVGMTERTIHGVEKMYGIFPAYKMYLNNLKNISSGLGLEEHAWIMRTIRTGLEHPKVLKLTEILREAISKVDRRLIDDPLQQAVFLAKQAYKHFESHLDLVRTFAKGAEPKPSIILQKMICTVRHDDAYAGVLNSRNTQTGTGVELHTAHNIFGEEMMTGTAEFDSSVFDDRTAIKSKFPAVYHFLPSLDDLEEQFESPVTIEFGVEATAHYQSFALLQLNRTGMSGQAALISAVDMHKAGVISRQRVTELIRPYHIKQLTSNTIGADDYQELKIFCSGVSVLPQIAVAVRIYFSSSAALSAKRRGETVCLCKKAFSPADSAVMREMDAIISLTWAAIHVVTICQSLGIPALLSLESYGVNLMPGGLLNSVGDEIREGDWITISSSTSTIYEGEAKPKKDKLGRLVRYMNGERITLADEERKSFDSISYAFRYFQLMNRNIERDQATTINEVIRLVNFELRGEPEDARQLVNGWFDNHKLLYMEEVLKSDIGDHLSQSNVFDMLTLDRKIIFFKQALAKCLRERISGYAAGAFMLGRYLSQRYPIAFWKVLNPVEIGLCVNEWVLFEKYMQLLNHVGEKEVVLARKQILTKGLEELQLHKGKLHCFITLKLSTMPLQEAKDSLPDWSDPQSAYVLDLLQQPYCDFFDFNAPWSVHQLEKICEEEGIAVPKPSDV